jgi:hypothetical protein
MELKSLLLETCFKITGNNVEILKVFQDNKVLFLFNVYLIFD